MRSQLLILLGLCCCSGPVLGQSKPSSAFDFINLITTYRASLKAARSDSERLPFLYQLANKYSSRNEDSAAYFAKQGISYAQKLRDKRWLILLYGQLGRSCESTGQPQLALSLLKKAEQLGLQYYPKDSVMADTQLLLASYYTKQGNEREALPQALAALRYYETNRPDNSLLICRIYNTLGILNTNLKNFPQAIGFFEKQRELGKTVLNGFYVYLSCTNLADIYVQLGQYDRAEDEARRGLAKARELKHNRGVGFSLLNLADVLAKTKHYAEALDTGQQALQVMQQIADKRLIGIVQIGLAETTMALRQYDAAANYARQAVTQLRLSGDRSYTRQALEIQAQVLEQTHDYQAALLAFKEAKVLNDSLINVNKAKEVSRIQGSFDLERKENQIQLLNKNLAIEQLQTTQRQKQLLLLDGEKRAADLQNQLLTRRQQLNQARLNVQAVDAKRQKSLIVQQQDQLEFARQQRLLYLAILLLLIAITSLIGYFYNRQQRARRLLIVQKEAIQQQAAQLAELNITKDKLFSLISHDLRSPLASVKNNISQIRSAEKEPALLLPLVNRLEGQVDNVLNLLTNLLDWSMLQIKGFQSILRPIRLRDMGDEVLAQAGEQLRVKNITVFDHIDATHYVLADKHQLQAVFRNVLANAIKFTPRAGYIRVISLMKDDQIELQIRDSGQGMSAEQLSRIFSSPDLQAGTEGERGVGLGLQICREMMDRQHGSFHIQNGTKGGAIVHIRLAVSTDHAPLQPA